MGDILVLVAALAVYPLAVLGVALTGPHSSAERRARLTETPNRKGSES